MVWMKVPYTNFHNLNQDWIISMMMEFRETMDHIISLSTVKYADPIAWNITTQYEANTVVIDQQSGIAYLSTQPVPSGINITNTDYWTKIFDLQLFLTGIREGITFAIETSGYASAARSAGDLVWVNSELLEVLSAMASGDAYNTGAGGNSRRISIEQLLKDLQAEIDQYTDALAEETQARTEADQALQDNIDAEAATRAAEDARIEAKIVTNQDVYTVTPSMVGDYMARGQACAAMVYGDTLYSLSTTNYDDYGVIRRYSISGNTLIDEKRIRVGHGNSMAYNAAENAFYIAPVSRFSGGSSTNVQEVFKYDPTFSTLTVLQAPGDMHALSYDSATGIMYVMRSYHDGTVSIYTLENNAFNMVRTIDLTFMQNNGSLLQDIAVYDGIAYISNYRGNVCKINLASGELLGIFFVEKIDAGRIYDMGELEGFEFNESGVLYGVFTRPVNYAYDSGDGASVPDSHGCFVQIPVRNYVRNTVNGANVNHATLDCRGDRANQLYRGDAEIINPAVVSCRLDLFTTVRIYGSVTTNNIQQIQKNVNYQIEADATWTLTRIYLLGGICGLYINGGTLVTTGQYVIDCVDRVGMIMIDINGTVSGPGATSNSFIRWTNAKVPVALGRLTGMPNGTLGVMTYQRNPATFSIGSTLIG